MSSAAYWIEQLKMEKHPEGGYYKRTYLSQGIIPQSAFVDSFPGDRNFSSSIYFLLEHPNFSAFHRIKSDELWHFYSGDTLNIFVIQPSGELEILKLGNNPQTGESFQHVVKAGCWFASAPEKENTFSLVGCTVSPAFDFRDLELAERKFLIQQFPQYEKIIVRLTR